MKPDSLARIMSWRACSSGGSFLSQFGLVRAISDKRSDAFGRHRMRLRIGVGEARGEHRLVGEALEGLVHALRRLVGRGQEFHRRAVGGLFMRALVGQQRALRGMLAAHDGRHAGLARAVRGAAADALPAAIAAAPSSMAIRAAVCTLASSCAQLRQMAAGDMAGLVRQHADDLVRGGRIRRARRY